MSADRSARLVRVATLSIGLALPSLSLIPFGSLWLWQHGYLLYWAIASAGLVVFTYGWQRWLLRRPLPKREATFEKASSESDSTDYDPAWTTSDRRAWDQVLRIARVTNPASLSSRDALLAKAAETIRAVAHQIHPEIREPFWQFTLPEALTIIERVSRRLATFSLDHIPLSDRLTIARILTLYRWRGAIDVAERAYDVWRVIRLANPMTAATNEIREQLSREMYQWGRDHVMRQLSEAFIKEVGRAAIDLYGGRLRLPAETKVRSPADDAAASPDQTSGLRRFGRQASNAAKAVARSLRRR